MRRFPLVLLLISQIALAQEPERSVVLDESYGEQFLHYRPYVSTAKKKEQPKPSPKPAEPEKAVEKEGKQKVDVAWLRKNYPVLEERAINNPDDKDAVDAYLYAKRIILDKGQRFQMAVSAAVAEDPLLNENNRVPYSSLGAQSVANANWEGQQRAVQELAKKGGLMVFVDGKCRFCDMQIPMLEAIRANYGMEFMVISIDGTKPKSHAGQIATDNGMFRKLGLKLTPSTVYIPSPSGFKDGEDKNTYLIISQGFYTQQGMVKQLAFAGHKTKLLSEVTMQDLKVWERGVAATSDLRELELDPNKPATFKEALQPLLMKQYR